MIDQADQQTQPLPLDTTPVKRGRGRPVTGKAMTPAEKQKAYRERLKQRESKLEGTKLAYEEAWAEKREVGMKLIKTEARVLVLEQQLESALAEIERLRSGNVNREADTKDTRDLAYLLENLKRIIDKPSQNEKMAALEGFGVIIERMVKDRE